jgi:hypothetical protein
MPGKTALCEQNRHFRAEVYLQNRLKCCDIAVGLTLDVQK